MRKHNVDAAQSLAEILRLMGADVSVAHDGAHALELAQALGQPDIVLLDIGLPGMDGYATAREWRRRSGNSANLHARGPLWGLISPDRASWGHSAAGALVARRFQPLECC